MLVEGRMDGAETAPRLYAPSVDGDQELSGPG
jgi:hypothetical protein